MNLFFFFSKNSTKNLKVESHSAELVLDKEENENTKTGQERRRTSGTCARTSFLFPSNVFTFSGQQWDMLNGREEGGKDDEVVVVVAVDTWSNLFSLPPFPPICFTLHKRLKPKLKSPQNNNSCSQKIVCPWVCPCYQLFPKSAKKKKNTSCEKKNTRKRRLRTDKNDFHHDFLILFKSSFS